MTLEVVLAAAGLALLDTLSPATIGITIYILLAAHTGVARLLFTYLLTVAGFYFTLGAAIMLGLEAFLAAGADLLETEAAFWVQAGLGATMLAAALLLPTKSKGARRAPRAHTAAAMVGLGITTGLLEAAMALPYLGALGIMATAELPPHQWVPMVAGYNVVMVLPPVLLLLAWKALGPGLRPRLERWRDKLASGSRETFLWILGIAGFLVLRDAIYRLGGLDMLLS